MVNELNDSFSELCDDVNELDMNENVKRLKFSMQNLFMIFHMFKDVCDLHANRFYQQKV